MSDFCKCELERAGIAQSVLGEIPLFQVKNQLCEASFSTMGAHVISFKPAGQKEVLWVSKESIFKHGTPIRGGIPVCWPWFGPAGTPSHGTARISDWNIVYAKAQPDGSTTVIMALDKVAEYGLKVSLKVNFGTALTVELATENTGVKPYELSQALHTYFSIEDIRKTTVSGLDGLTYVDKVHGAVLTKQTGDVVFTEETDRIYQNVQNVIVFSDGSRRIKVERFGSDSAVVWNPWIAKAERMADFETSAWPFMLCVEAANAGSDVRTLVPGAMHTLATRISVL